MLPAGPGRRIGAACGRSLRPDFPGTQNRANTGRFPPATASVPTEASQPPVDPDPNASAVIWPSCACAGPPKRHSEGISRNRIRPDSSPAATTAWPPTVPMASAFTSGNPISTVRRVHGCPVAVSKIWMPWSPSAIAASNVPSISASVMAVIQLSAVSMSGPQGAPVAASQTRTLPPAPSDSTTAAKTIVPPHPAAAIASSRRTSSARNGGWAGVCAVRSQARNSCPIRHTACGVPSAKAAARANPPFSAPISGPRSPGGWSGSTPAPRRPGRRRRRLPRRCPVRLRPVP